MTKFQAFLTRASTCSSLFHPASPPSLSQRSQGSRSQSQSSPPRRLILLEDLPNILHPPTAETVHTALASLVAHPNGVPLVLIISDAGLRGEDPESTGGSGWRGKEAIDVRGFLGPLFSGPYVIQIACGLVSSHLPTAL